MASDTRVYYVGKRMVVPRMFSDTRVLVVRDEDGCISIMAGGRM